MKSMGDRSAWHNTPHSNTSAVLNNILHPTRVSEGSIPFVLNDVPELNAVHNVAEENVIDRIIPVSSLTKFLGEHSLKTF